MLKRFLNKARQKGQSMIFLAAALPVLFIFIGASADFGWMYFNQSRLQNAADAAVTAGAKIFVKDEQSASDYTYVTFVSNTESGLVELMASDKRPVKRDTKEGDIIAAQYVAKNLSKDNNGTYSGDWSYVYSDKTSGRKITLKQADAWNNNNDVNFESAFYGTDDADYKAIYYVVTLEEPLYHLFSIMDNLGFENLNTKVMAAVKISHNVQRLKEYAEGEYPHGPSLYTQMKEKEYLETYVDWDAIKYEKGGNKDKADQRSVITAGAFYDDGEVLKNGKRVSFKDGKTFRTELAVLDGYGMSFGKNYVDQNTSIKQYEWDDLFIDFQGEMQSGSQQAMNDYADVDMADIVIGTDKDTKNQDFNNNTWDYSIKGYSGDGGNGNKGNYKGTQPEYEFRVHYPVNIVGTYKVRKGSEFENEKDPPDPIYAFFEREPIRKSGWYKTYTKGDINNLEYVSISGRGNMSAVRQIIINNKIDNYTNEDSYRPIVFFYEGPEPYRDDDEATVLAADQKGIKNNTKNNSVYPYDGTTYNGIRQSQPVILNLYADFRGILFAPKSAVAINGNNYNFEGFVVAAEYVKLMQESDYVQITYDGKTCYAKKEDLAKSSTEHKIIDVTYNGKSYKVNSANLRETYHKYQYPLKVEGDKTYYVNNLYSLVDHEEFNPDSTENKGKYTKVYYWGHPYYIKTEDLSTSKQNPNYTVKLNDENTQRYFSNMNQLQPFHEYSDVEVTYKGATYYIPLGAIIYKVTEETVAYSGSQSRKVTYQSPDTKVGGLSEINENRTYITTKFSDGKGHDNPIFVDFHGNVQYGDTIKPTAALASGFTKNDPASTYEYNDQTFDTSDDFTFAGNPFNLASVKYNSFTCVTLVDYTYLQKSEAADRSDTSKTAVDAFYLTKRSKHID